MDTIKILNYLRKFFYLSAGVLFGFLISAPLASELSNTIGIITQNIDSLDLLKQDLKRKGQAIIEIEQQQDLLRDSLHQLRIKLQTTSEVLPKTSGKKRTALFFLKPANLFDWIIVVTGLIASFSGLMLIIGIFRILGLKRKRKPRKPPVEDGGIVRKGNNDKINNRVTRIHHLFPFLSGINTPNLT